jgi:mRNA-degrading endonuclease RelE of RelBE toxin-antitoxin system
MMPAYEIEITKQAFKDIKALSPRLKDKIKGCGMREE